MKPFAFAICLFALLPAVASGQMGAAFAFPEGESSLQVSLPDTVKITCSTWGNDELTGEPVLYHDLIFQFVDSIHLQAISPSFFTREILQNHYFFLLGPGLDRFALQDYDYSLLRFFRYKSQGQNLAFALRDTTEDDAGPVQLRKLVFKQSVRVKFFEFNKSWNAEAKTYLEYWECGAKSDYSPTFPCLMGWDKKGRPFINPYDPDQNVILFVKSLRFSLAALSLDDNNRELDKCRGASREATLFTVDGRAIKGYSLDLNRDNIPDAFWHTVDMPSDTYERYTTLFLNVGGEWQPYWFSYDIGRF